MSDAIARAIDWLERTLAAFDVVDRVLLGIGVALLARAVLWLIVPARLGTVEVSAGEGLDPSHLTRLREALATTGLLPAGGVPAGAPKGDVVAAIEASPLPQSEWLAALVKV